MLRGVVWARNVAEKGWWSELLEGMRCRQNLCPLGITGALCLPHKTGELFRAEILVSTQPRALELSTAWHQVARHGGCSNGAEESEGPEKGELQPVVQLGWDTLDWYPVGIHWSLGVGGGWVEGMHQKTVVARGSDGNRH